jgi:hypothetical protein
VTSLFRYTPIRSKRVSALSSDMFRIKSQLSWSAQCKSSRTRTTVFPAASAQDYGNPQNKKSQRAKAKLSVHMGSNDSTTFLPIIFSTSGNAFRITVSSPPSASQSVSLTIYKSSETATWSHRSLNASTNAEYGATVKASNFPVTKYPSPPCVSMYWLVSSSHFQTNRQ